MLTFDRFNAITVLIYPAVLAARLFIETCSLKHLCCIADSSALSSYSSRYNVNRIFFPENPTRMALYSLCAVKNLLTFFVPVEILMSSDRFGCSTLKNVALKRHVLLPSPVTQKLTVMYTTSPRNIDGSTS